MRATSADHPSAKPAAAPVERFGPTNGALLGSLGLGAIAAAVTYLLLAERSVDGLRTVLALAFAGAVIWATMLRPRAAATRQTLVLRNAVSDVHVPLVLVEAVAVRQTLNVWAAGRRWQCIGIGRSTRSLVRSGTRPGASGPSAKGATEAYDQFVVDRIDSLAERARREARPEAPAPVVRRTWAWPEIAALAATALGFALTLLA